MNYIIIYLDNMSIGLHYFLEGDDITITTGEGETFKCWRGADNDLNSLRTIVSEYMKENIDNKEEALYVYSSGDNAATKGNPELLYVYYMNEKEISFKYHAAWNNNDIVGVARSAGENKYVFENGNKKIELELNSMGENSIKVSEYENNELSSYKNLWK